MRSELRIKGIASGHEAAVLASELDQVQPGDLVVYWSGHIGGLPRSLATAAHLAHMAGRCLLVQRIRRAEAIEGEPEPPRLVDYIAIKAGQK